MSISRTKFQHAMRRMKLSQQTSGFSSAGSNLKRSASSCRSSSSSFHDVMEELDKPIIAGYQHYQAFTKPASREYKIILAEMRAEHRTMQLQSRKNSEQRAVFADEYNTSDEDGDVFTESPQPSRFSRSQSAFRTAVHCAMGVENLRNKLTSHIRTRNSSSNHSDIERRSSSTLTPNPIALGRRASFALTETEKQSSYKPLERKNSIAPSITVTTAKKVQRELSSAKTEKSLAQDDDIEDDVEVVIDHHRIMNDRLFRCISQDGVDEVLNEMVRTDLYRRYGFPINWRSGRPLPRRNPMLLEPKLQKPEVKRRSRSSPSRNELPIIQ